MEMCGDVMCGDVMCGDVMCGDVMGGDVMCGDVMCEDDVVCVMCQIVWELCAHYYKLYMEVLV